MKKSMIIKMAMAYKNDTTENKINTCFQCPLKFTCSLWLWDRWNINLELCDCTDERLICLDDSFKPDFKLLDTWKTFD